LTSKSTAVMPRFKNAAIAALERAMIWPNGMLFHRDPMPPRVESGA